jgi:hypothetical protein
MMQTEINEYWLQDVIKNIRNETLDVAPEILIKALAHLLLDTVAEAYPQFDEGANRAHCARLLMYGADR